jgi:uncharacterized membrane protein YeaQ/YmgE (transglycosylase-associated protein family)
MGYGAPLLKACVHTYGDLWKKSSKLKISLSLHTLGNTPFVSSIPLFHSHGGRMSILNGIWYIISGFIVGLIARAVLPGADAMGFLATTVVGILGSLLGGFVGGLFSKPKEGVKFHRAGFLMSLVGAVVLLLAWRYLGQ